MAARDETKIPDYGWRLRGRAVSVLADHSFDLGAFLKVGSSLEAYCRDVRTLEACLQCGAHFRRPAAFHLTIHQ